MRQFSQIKSWDRTLIARYRARGISISAIASSTGFHKSTISRELRRNPWYKHRYKALHAQKLRDDRNHKAMKERSGVRGKTYRWIINRLKESWSPEQIAGRSKIDGPQSVSHEFIYQFIRDDKKKGGKLHENLRRFRKKSHWSKPKKKRSKIPNRRDISTRPKQIEDRIRLGDLEGDLIEGRLKRSYIAVGTDRVSRLVRLERLKTRTSKDVNRGFRKIIRRHGRAKTMTLDNATEFSRHEELSKQTGVRIYFTEPYSAWQKGTVENMNGLVRQFLPRKTDFRRLTVKELRHIEALLNHRPRKCLSYKTPLERHWAWDPLDRQNRVR